MSNYLFHWEVFLQKASANATYLDWIIDGIKVTVIVGLASWLLALALGTLLGVLRTLPNRAASGFAAGYVEVFRNVPLLVQLFIWYYAAPELLPGGQALKDLNPVTQQLLAAVVCLGTFTAARVCEQVRAGINSLSHGQKNAALALGMGLPQTYRHVLLPMAIRIIVPPLTTEFVNVFQNSAVASTIGLLDLAGQGRQLVDYTARPYESFIVVTLLYFGLNAAIMVFMRWVEHRARVPGYIGSR
jgi:glutamate/aspartate transport system permease protein